VLELAILLRELSVLLLLRQGVTVVLVHVGQSVV
jgi:hypothetical protein